jgi:hypothetical protein
MKRLKISRYKVFLIVLLVVVVYINIYSGANWYIYHNSKSNGFDKLDTRTQHLLLHSYDALLLLNAHFGKLTVGVLPRECSGADYQKNDRFEYNRFIQDMIIIRELRPYQLYGYAGSGFTPNSKIELGDVFGFQNGVPVSRAFGTIYADKIGNIISCNFYTPFYDASAPRRQDVLFAAVGERNGHRYVLVTSAIFINEQ